MYFIQFYAQSLDIEIVDKDNYDVNISYETLYNYNIEIINRYTNLYYVVFTLRNNDVTI